MSFIKAHIKNIIIIILLVLFLGASILIYYLSKNEPEEKQTSISGTIIVADASYVIIETAEEDYLINNIKGLYNIGDEVRFTYSASDLDDKVSPKTIKISDEELLQVAKVSENNASEISENKLESQSNETSLRINTNTIDASDNVLNNTNNFSSLTDDATTMVPEESTNADEAVLTYINNLKSDVEKNGITSNIKTGFITIVDFLFYNGTIKGHTLNELSNSAKLKVLSVALYLDNKIDTYFPGYKETISSSVSKTYTNIKNKIVETYLNITVAICENNSDTCESAKEGFNELKNNFGLTWSLIKDIAGDGLANLKNWYEIWSGR